MSHEVVVQGVLVEIGQIIKDARERKRPRMSQAALGLIVGVDKKTISKWERGLQFPSRHLVVLEDALGIKLTNRQASPARPTELAEMTYSDLLNQQMRIVAELARRGEPAGERDGAGEQLGVSDWTVTRRGDLPHGGASATGGTQ